jgi:hypothetical protein
MVIMMIKVSVRQVIRRTKTVEIRNGEKRERKRIKFAENIIIRSKRMKIEAFTHPCICKQ